MNGIIFGPDGPLNMFQKPSQIHIHNNNPDGPSTTSSSDTSSSQYDATTTHADNDHPRKLDLQLVLLDNYDSYTYNIYSYLCTICATPPKVISNDAYDSWDDLMDDCCVQQPHGRIDGIVISPGPGRPERSEDMGVCLEAIEKNPNVPILGVCLGHQALGHCYNASVKLAPHGPVHGLMSKVSFVNNELYTMNGDDDDGEKKDNGNQHERVHGDSRHIHDSDNKGDSDSDIDSDSDSVERQPHHCDIFKDIPQSFEVVRYHSLVVEFPMEETERDALPVEAIAWCKPDTAAEEGGKDDDDRGNASSDSICMALRHKIHPHYGVQFHPESVGTGEYGYTILQNFCDFCVDWRRREECDDVDVSVGTDMDATMLDTNARTDIHDNGHVNGKKGKEGLEHVVHENEREEPLNGANMKQNGKYNVLMRKISSLRDGAKPLPSPERVYEHLFSTMDDSFWLDSSTGRKDADLEERNKPSAFGTDGGCPIVSNSRFSIMGGNLGPLCRKIEYWGKDHPEKDRGLFVTDGIHETRRVVESDQEDIISFLHHEIMENGVTDAILGLDFDSGNVSGTGYQVKAMDLDSIPFEYRGGYVGYLGYEVRHDTRRNVCEQEICGASINQQAGHRSGSDSSSNPLVPTAAFLFADRSLVYDHWRDEWYLVGVAESAPNGPSNDSTKPNDESYNEVAAWMQNTLQQMESMSAPREQITSKKKGDLKFDLKRSREKYAADIARCHNEIKNGESYELCLTNQLSTKVHFADEAPDPSSPAPLELYKILRRNNPAPFAAFMNFDSTKQDVNNRSSVSICCSSPERFLSVNKSDRLSGVDLDEDDSRRHGWEFAPPFISNKQDSQPSFTVESKPIKGTASRIIVNEHDNDNDMQAKQKEDEKIAEELRKSAKNRAENLMIVDLLRNDLSRVCEPGSVHVPKLMSIESFATVHQMVSTIRGVIDAKYTPIDVIAACFPGGSMTGAPKLRSVDILDDLELGNSRGPYSGCLGYISLNGSMDMNIVIRTAVVTPDRNLKGGSAWDVSIGAGGAITALSDSEDEFEEMLLKASAICKSVEEWSGRSNNANN